MPTLSSTLTGFSCFQESLLLLVLLSFLSFIWASGSPDSSCVTVVSPSLPWVLHTLCPCCSQLFPSRTKVLREILFIAFLHGIPASASSLFLGLPHLHCINLSSLPVSPGVSPEVWPPGSPTVFPSGMHVMFAPVTIVPASSTTPCSRQMNNNFSLRLRSELTKTSFPS